MKRELQLDYFYIGDVLKKLRKISSKSVRCVVTSPPYYGLRDYGTATWLGGDPDCDHSRSKDIVKDLSGGKPGQIHGYAAKRMSKDNCKKCGAIRVDNQIGLEKTPELYIKKLVQVFREIRRILTDDGTLWLNIGDSYWGGKGASGAARPEKQKERLDKGETISRVQQSIGEKGWIRPADSRHSVIKPKDLIGIPWMLALALRRDGWYLRNDIIWSKPNPMPSSATDRCTVSHEYIFLLTKSAKYYYDSVAIRQPLAESVLKDKRLYDDDYQTGRPERGYPGQSSKGGGLLKRKSGNLERKYGDAVNQPDDSDKHQGRSVPWEGDTANKKTVWNVSAKGFNGEFCTACQRFYSGPEKKMITRKEITGEDGRKTKVSTCLCGRHDAWIAHFATFPQNLIVDCIKAGSSDRGQCADCGKPWVRVAEKELKPTVKAVEKREVPTRANGNEAQQDSGYNHEKAGFKKGWHNHFNTTGWQPSCECHGKLKKHTEKQEPTPIYDPDDDTDEIIDWVEQEDKVCYTYESDLPLIEHTVKPDVILDPFSGAGTTPLVSKKLHRNFIAIDINPHYAAMSIQRLKKELGMFYTPQTELV